MTEQPDIVTFLLGRNRQRELVCKYCTTYKNMRFNDLVQVHNIIAY